MDALPIVLFWGLALWGIASRRPVLLYLFFCTMPFGAFAVIPPGVSAGLTLTPTPMVALLIALRNIASRNGTGAWAAMAVKPSRLALLFLFWLVSVFTTVFMPRLFAGKVVVIPMRMTYATRGELLFPTTQNISQLVYLTISVAVVFAFARILRSAPLRQTLLRAMVAGAAVCVFTGVLDYLTQFLPITPLLEPFRTATYALLTNDEILGSKRVVGLMSEASAFGGLALTFLAALYFFRRGIEDRKLRERIVPIVMGGLLLMVWLSTSSAAYVGLAVLGVVVASEWVWRAAVLRRGNMRRRGLGGELWIVGGVLLSIGLVGLVQPSLFDPIAQMLDKMVLQKTASASFQERSMWTAVSWNSLWDSYGLGVGLGSTRASNGVVSIIASTGLLGGALFFAFLFQNFTRRPVREASSGDALMAATFWSYLPPFITFILAGTSPNFGVFNGFLFGLGLALATRQSIPGPVSVSRTLSRTPSLAHTSLWAHDR